MGEGIPRLGISACLTMEMIRGSIPADDSFLLGLIK